MILNSILNTIYQPLNVPLAKTDLQKGRNWAKLTTSPQVDTFEKSTIKDDAKKYIPILKDKIRPDNIIGEGSEARVYALNKNYVIRVLKHKIETKGETQNENENQQFIKVPELFDGQNFGQPVLISNDKSISINKFISGKPMYPVGDIDTKDYLQTLHKFSELSDNCLERFVKDFSYLDGQGYSMDPNPENFLYDSKKDRIGFVDIAKKDEKQINYEEPLSHVMILYPLVNGRQVARQYTKMSLPERQEMFDLIDKTEKRILPLCNKYKIPKAKWNPDEYVQNSLILIGETRNKFDLTKDFFTQAYPFLI